MMTDKHTPIEWLRFTEVERLHAENKELRAEIENLRELLAAASDYIAHDERSSLWREVRAALGREKE